MKKPGTSGMKYYGTDDDVRLGDVVEVSRWLRTKYRGVVTYIPGLSAHNAALEYDDVRQWAITSENGNIYPILFDPASFQPPKHIRLVRRGHEQHITPTDRLA